MPASPEREHKDKNFIPPVLNVEAGTLFSPLQSRGEQLRSDAETESEILHREEIKSGARNLGVMIMNLKNCKYMKSAEFKARQVWLPFVDAVGIALQVMAEVKEQAADWLKDWIKDFRTPRTIEKQEQIELNFSGMRSLTQMMKDWPQWTPEKNKQLFE